MDLTIQTNKNKFHFYYISIYTTHVYLQTFLPHTTITIPIGFCQLKRNPMTFFHKQEYSFQFHNSPRYKNKTTDGMISKNHFLWISKRKCQHFVASRNILFVLHALLNRTNLVLRGRDTFDVSHIGNFCTRICVFKVWYRYNLFY